MPLLQSVLSAVDTRLVFVNLESSSYIVTLRGFPGVRLRAPGPEGTVFWAGQ